MSRSIQREDFILLGNDITSPVFIIINDPEKDYPIVGLNLNGSGEKVELIYQDGWRIKNLEVSPVFLGKEVRPWWRYKIEQSLPDGIIPFGKTRKILDPKDLLDMQPGDHYQFLEFHFKFFDFALPDSLPYKDIVFNLKHRESCNWSISKDFYVESIARGRYIITITFLPENWKKESLAAFLIAEPSEIDIYYWLICARAFMDETGVMFSPSFGTLLQCIMSRYSEKAKYQKVILDALPNCVSYYQKFGFRLLYKNGEKFRMVTENISADNLCKYALGKARELQTFASTHRGFLVIA